MITKCLNNKIANSHNRLKPIILRAILKLYQNGKNEISANMVKVECLQIDNTIAWNNKITAICNSMRNVLDCGARITGEDRDFNGFTILFGEDNSETNEVNIQSITHNNINEAPLDILDLAKINLSNSFKVIIICSSKKKKSNFDNYPNIKFKAVSNNINEFHPEDLVPNSKINWREYLVNHQNDENLLCAYDLYSKNVYHVLHEKFKQSLYILSAGWGLVHSEFKLPNYDITFSKNAELKTKRKMNGLINYNDFNQLNASENEDIIFIGSVDYLPLFFKLTENLKNRKLIFYFGIGGNLPKPTLNIDSFKFIRYESSNNRSWHYDLANDLSRGFIQ
jgi:hypothetical protein